MEIILEKNSDIPLNQTILYALGIVGICFCVFSVTKCSSTPEMTQALETCNTPILIKVEDAKNVSNFTLDKTEHITEAMTKCREDVTNVFRKPELIAKPL